MPTEEQKRQLKSWAVWEEAKSGQNLDDADEAEILKTAGKIADENGMEQAHQWLIDLYEAYELASIRMDQMINRLDRDYVSQETALQIKLKSFAANAAAAASGFNTDPTPVRKLELLQELKNRYINLGLNSDEMDAPDCVVKKLSAGDLKILNEKLEMHPVKSYAPIRVRDRWVRMPYQVSGFPLVLGPEITRDWIVPRPGHGFPIKRIKQSWDAILKNPELVKPTETHGNLAYELNKIRVVTNKAATDLITYFETPYGV